MDRFGKRLKRLRKEAGFKSAVEFAKAIGVNPLAYRNYEYSERKPKLSTVLKIAEVLHVSTDELLGHSGISNYADRYFALKAKLEKLLEEEKNNGKH